ncbi:SpoIVB peptidase S55 domain-containing protein [Synoicihabitans lomoniglobus]|uniref:SpoIVB peptidase S55 domain-containing protein n=1 Tax=Synoicihabitans lomoniglobus TaxID=2909285 RepID=A0AAF0CRK8_9BACT|nr:hypothetical protein [Opitutaceae bacterium LMO-M01]WED66789.1 SpoIVB peptidase S55 domain-containing protein [Opitutaceae bacterium LMO-M01]
MVAQPQHAEVLPLSELAAGMEGEVWTVFQGTQPEPFTVKVTGVIANALGPGKSMILCELTDPRVQNMGAVAGMSGSPLYIDGRFAGALSYQVQRFETVRFAGFTPADDLLEVRRIAMDLSTPLPGSGDGTIPAQGPPAKPMTSSRDGLGDRRDGALAPLSPVFAFGGLSPQVTALVSGPLAELGIHTTTLGGATSGGSMDMSTSATLAPGQAVGAALAVGDITLAGTGTVSQVDGNRILAFGHPLLGLGTVEVPMTTAEIVAILPSNLSSFKISNTGPVIGTVRQDRLSAIYGELGAAPPMVPVTVISPQRTLNFATVRHPRLTPAITAAGLSQAVLGSNDAGLSEGFAITTQVNFPGGRKLTTERLFAGPEGFKQSLAALTQSLTTWMQNPVEEVFPDHVTFRVEPLPTNPTASLDNVQFSHRQVAIGKTLKVTLSLRDFQSQPWQEIVKIPMASDWRGRELEILISSGPALDNLSGGQTVYPVSQIRDFDAYLDVLRAQRRPDGLYVAVVTKSSIFLDQTESTLELPGSLARVARSADSARFNQRAAREILWETHILPHRLVPGLVRQPLRVTD